MEKMRRSEKISTLLTDAIFNWEYEMGILHSGIMINVWYAEICDIIIETNNHLW